MRIRKIPSKMMTYTWACNCGAEIECEREDFALGAVFQCPACLKVYGAVQPKIGGKVWIEISDSDVKFHKLLDEPEEED